MVDTDSGSNGSKIALVAAAALVVAATVAPCRARIYDPLRPQVHIVPTVAAAAKAAQPLQLQATLVAEQRRVAVINGTRFKVGDTVNGYRIKQIDAARVQLEADGEQRQLRLRTNVVTHSNTDTDGVD